MDKNNRATLLMVASELENLSMFDAANLRLSKWEGADPLRQEFERQYAKLRRLGHEIRKVAQND